MTMFSWQNPPDPPPVAIHKRSTHQSAAYNETQEIIIIKDNDDQQKSNIIGNGVTYIDMVIGDTIVAMRGGVEGQIDPPEEIFQFELESMKVE